VTTAIDTVWQGATEGIFSEEIALGESERVINALANRFASARVSRDDLRQIGRIKLITMIRKIKSGESIPADVGRYLWFGLRTAMISEIRATRLVKSTRPVPVDVDSAIVAGAPERRNYGSLPLTLEEMTLSPEERVVVDMLLAENTIAAIAAKLGRSPLYVRGIRDRLRIRFNRLYKER